MVPVVGWHFAIHHDGESKVSEIKKEGDWFKDQNGTLFQTNDGKPPATSGTPITVGDRNGGTSKGTYSDGQAKRG